MKKNIAFLLLLRQKFDFLWNVSPHVFSDGRGPTLKRLSESPDQLFGIFAADVLWRSIQIVCQRNRHRYVLAFELHILDRLLAFARVQQRLAPTSNTMACGKVSFFFFGYSGLSLKSCSQRSISSKPSSRIALLLSNVLTNCISRVSPLLPCFVFSKATTSLRRPGKHSGQPCQWQPWN